jgi:hypothetical protein
MKKKLCYIVVLASFIGCATLSQAATYSMDFDESVATTSAFGVFDIDAFPVIDAASIEFVIRGKTTAVNSRGYYWYYDPNIDLSIIDTQVLDNHHLGGDFLRCFILIFPLRRFRIWNPVSPLILRFLRRKDSGGVISAPGAGIQLPHFIWMK